MLQKIKNFFATAGGYILATAVTLLWIFTKRSPGNEVRNDSRRRAKDEEVIASREAKSAESRETRAKEAESKRNKFILPLILLLILMGTVSVKATDNLYIPDNYDELKEYYLELWELCEEYRSLYYEAETSVKALHESNARLQEVIKSQQDYINSLKRTHLGIMGGGSWTPQGWGANVGIIILF